MAAEGVGLAASVAGLVSLGLQITGGIVKYVDAFKGRREELDFVRRQNDALAANLRLFQGWAPSPGQSPDIDAAVAHSIQLVNSELVGVKALHDKLADNAGQSWAAKFENTKKRSTYPFNQAKIQELGQRLQKAMDALLFAMNVMGLRTLRQQADRMTAMDTAFSNFSSQTALIHSDMTAMTTPILAINDQLRSLHGGVDATTQLLVSHNASLSNRVQQSEENILRDGEATKQILSSCFQLIARQHEETNRRLALISAHVEQNQPVMSANLAVARKLAGKPAYLKDVADAALRSVQSPDPTTTPDLRIRSSQHIPRRHRSIRGCTCPRPQTSKEWKTLKLGHSYFFDEREATVHWPGCQMANLPEKKRVTLVFKFNGLARMLQKAIELSFTLTSGAGGFSITPTFTCNPTVDDDVDPAFRIISLMKDHVRFNTQDPKPFLLSCVYGLNRLLGSGMVWPTITNYQNQSLMHRALNAIRATSLIRRECRQASIEPFTELIEVLLSYGVAAFTYDRSGNSPIISFEQMLDDQDLLRPVIDVLTQNNHEQQPATLRDKGVPYIRFGRSSASMQAKTWYEMSSGFAEAWNCGPLSLAILANDGDQVNDFLQRKPYLLAERDMYGQSPLHLAANKPRILEVLLQRADRNLLDYRDGCGLTALETSMLHTSDTCINRRDAVRCNVKYCGCCQCIDLLITAGCHVRTRPNDPEEEEFIELQHILASASELARRKYVFYMREVWVGFRQVETAMSDASAESLNATRPPKRGRDFASIDTTFEMGWIFNEIADVHIAALFYRHEFRPHPSCLTLLRLKRGGMRDVMNPAYFDWLVTHGVNISSRSPNGPSAVKGNPRIGLFGAHFAFFYLESDLTSLNGDYSLTPASISMQRFTDLMALILNQHLTDGCRCHCTTAGCSPFTWMMKGNWWMDFWRHGDAAPRHFVTDLTCHYSRCGPELTECTYKAAIRYATFIGLGMVHTCCDARDIAWERKRWVKRNDVDIVNGEQHVLVEKLEELVLEFEEKATLYIAVDAEGNSKFPRFWSHYWIQRMEEELRKLDGSELTPKERRDAEEIGVRWENVELKEEKQDQYDEDDARYWFRELEKICPE